MESTPYDPAWFSSHQDLARTSAEAVAPVVMGLVAPKSVVDVGCGVGEWLMAFKQCGVHTILGLDGGYVRQANMRIPAACFRETDLTLPVAVEERFDLAVCLEVAEHLPPESAEGMIDLLTRLAPVVLFSAAIPKQGGQDHRHEQWPEYWQTLFAKHGFVAVDCLRARFWDDPTVAWYYSQNMLLYAAHQHLAQYPALAPQALRAAESVRRLVHPARFLSTANVECFSLGIVLRALPVLVARSLRIHARRWLGQQP